MPAVEFLAARAAEWDALAQIGGTPYVSSPWLRAWLQSYAPEAVCLVRFDDSERLIAGACVIRNGRRLRSATNVETGDWGIVATDSLARATVWRHLVATSSRRIRLDAVTEESAAIARAALRANGYVVATRRAHDSPVMNLPADWRTLEAGLSRNLRSQLRRRSRDLERLGEVRLRTSAPISVDDDFERFVALEASGWKGRAGTAIACSPRSFALYRDFVAGAAELGWARLQFLELDGVPIAADLSCAFAGGIFMLKTAYDERLREQAPGFVLRAHALRAAIDEGALFYDFLGGADAYKLRWADASRQHFSVRGYAGPVAPAVAVWERALRPPLKRACMRMHDHGAEEPRLPQSTVAGPVSLSSSADSA